MRTASSRLRWPILAVVLIVALVASGMVVAQEGDGDVYTGCLNAGGNIHSVAIGTKPLKPCPDDQAQISWNVHDPSGPPGGDDQPSLYSKFCNVILEPGDEAVDVMMLEIPAGKWLAHVSIQAGPLGPCGGGHPLQGEERDGNYGCVLTGGVNFSGGHPASSRTGEFRTLAWSEPVVLEQESNVAVRCQFSGSSGDGAALSVGDFVITPANAWELQSW